MPGAHRTPGVRPERNGRRPAGPALELERGGHVGRPQGMPVRRLDRGNGQALPALPATGGKNFPATLGLHASAKTVGLLAMAVAGAISALHRSNCLGVEGIHIRETAEITGAGKHESSRATSRLRTTGRSPRDPGARSRYALSHFRAIERAAVRNSTVSPVSTASCGARAAKGASRQNTLM